MQNNNTVSLTKLKDVPKTLLIPLIARCVETGKKDGLLKDPRSVEILEGLDYDFSRSGLFLPLQLGVCLRTLIFDEQIVKFLNQNPDAVVINLGSGLDTRFPRVDNGRVRWFDLDLPESIEIRKRFFKETDRHRFIAKSALDPSWTDEIPKDSKTLIVAEGLCMYFTENEMKDLIRIIKNSFPGSQFLFEAFSPRLVKSNKNKAESELDRNAAELLKWGIKSGKEMENWFNGIRFVNEWFVIDKGRRHFPLYYRISFFLVPMLARFNKVVHLSFV
jgi:O-methyltransferase involved in polyketide biosynthesis